LTKFHDWNRRKSTQEILKDLALGDYPKFSKILSAKQIVIFDKKRNYFSDLEKLTIEATADVTFATKNIANIFEFLAINIKNNTIDDDFCYDYIGFMYIEFYRWCKDYIESLQVDSHERRILYNFETKANEWALRNEMEVKPNTVKGKDKL
jgi:hypothetical protein